MIWMITNTEYRTNVVSPIGSERSDEKQFATEIIGDTPSPVFTFSDIPNARVSIPARYIEILFSCFLFMMR